MTILSMKSVEKEFYGVYALKGVSLSVDKGEVVSLCGENGSGKSTLMKIVTGIYPYKSYGGQVMWQGQLAKFRNIHDAESAGIAIIHQELSTVKNLTVAENMFLGNEKHKYGVLDMPKIIAETYKMLEAVGLKNIDPEVQMYQLNTAQQQLAEIAKAVAKNAKLIVFDEPTSSLTETDVEVLLNMIRDLKKRGVASVFISHKLDEVMEISDKVHIIRDGESITEIKREELSRDIIISNMVGRPLTNLFPKEKAKIGEIVLSVKNLSIYDNIKHKFKVKDVNFEVKSGEVLGVAGLVGAGRSDIAIALIGEHSMKTEINMTINGKEIKVNSAVDALNAGIVMVPEDRKKHGIIGILPVFFNLVLSNLAKYQNFFGLNEGKMRSDTNKYVDILKIKTSSIDLPIAGLSGGNQQKVVIAKTLLTNPKVLILDEPTRGVDVGAKYEIYKTMNDLTAQGIAIIMISSELPEILGMSDRVMVVKHGQVSTILENNNLSQEDIMKHAI